MLEITRSNSKEIKEIISNYTVILYGAGSCGIQCFNILKEIGINADYFVDDDVNKQGTTVEGMQVLSFDELEEMSKQKEIHVILTSIYARPILSRLEPLNIPVYQMYSLFIGDGETAIDKIFSMKQSQYEWGKKYNIIEGALKDELSKKIWKHLGYVVKSRDLSYRRFSGNRFFRGTLFCFSNSSPSKRKIRFGRLWSLYWRYDKPVANSSHSFWEIIRN